MNTGRSLYDYWSGNGGAARPAGAGAAARPAGADPAGGHGALRAPRLRGRTGGGDRRAGGRVQGGGVRLLRHQGRLFLAAYQAAARSFPAYLDAPARIREEGFFAVLRYWIGATPHLIHEDWIPYRVTLIGNYCAGLQLRREITQFLAREDPYGTQGFVRFGIDRGEVRQDIDPRMIASMVDWLTDRVQDAMVTEELDPGLFGGALSAQEREQRVNEFLELVRGAVGAR